MELSAHVLARQLLALPDHPVVTYNGEDYPTYATSVRVQQGRRDMGGICFLDHPKTTHEKTHPVIVIY